MKKVFIRESLELLLPAIILVLLFVAAASSEISPELQAELLLLQARSSESAYEENIYNFGTTSSSFVTARPGLSPIDDFINAGEAR